MKCDMTNCPKVPLPELLSFIVDNRGKTVPTTESGHALIATNCIKNEHLYPVFEKIRFLSNETYTSWFRSHPEPGDIIFVNKGTPGRVCMVPNPVDFCIAQDMIAFRTNPNLLYNKYLLAVLRSAEIQTQINNFNVGDVIPHFKKSFLGELKIPLPNMTIQKEIGDIYFDLSEKIALNNRINKTLEEMAQAIFKSWFVDFEPWGGVMPEDWKEGLLSELITIKYGKDHKKLSNGIIPVFGSGGIMRFADTALYNKESVLIPRKGTLNNVFYVNYPFWSVDTMFYTEMKYPNIAKFVYFFLCSKDLVSMNAGSAVPSMTTEILNSLQIIIPTNEELSKFENIVSVQFKQMQENQRKNETLAAIRDALLPKLLSGEIEVNKENV